MAAPSAFSEYLDAVAARTAAPGGGSAGSTAAAVAAALVEMAARYSDDEDTAERAAALRGRFLELAEEDAAAYAGVLGARGEAREQALSRAAEPPLELAEAAAELTELARALAERGNPVVRGDARAGEALAAAATKIGATLVLLNLEGRDDDPRVERARELERLGLQTSSG
jgi:formiminotetrahydrofolate cyclodeaminase